ncbi:MAG: hypothetical protein EZS28_005096 [Streblomastix strix]|uniref:Uncharacterized protein n=1 Tax=Streblomastix strix TaxID=222440 RepID=A0A5J4WY26_9EUKA|nr:MAG: hypothetical protein EZS28_005096 [Streblomastix strix]
MLGDDMIDSYSGEDVGVNPGDRIDEADKSDDEEEFIFLLQMGLVLPTNDDRSLLVKTGDQADDEEGNELN